MSTDFPMANIDDNRIGEISREPFSYLHTKLLRWEDIKILLWKIRIGILPTNFVVNQPESLFCLHCKTKLCLQVPKGLWAYNCTREADNAWSLHCQHGTDILFCLQLNYIVEICKRPFRLAVSDGTNSSLYRELWSLLFPIAPLTVCLHVLFCLLSIHINKCFMYVHTFIELLVNA